MNYWTAKQIADFCCDVLITEKSNDGSPEPYDSNSDIEILIDHKSSIRSALIESDMNSDKIQSVGRARFIRPIIDRIKSRDKKVRSGLFKMFNILEPILSVYNALKWKHIVSAVAHEMNVPIAADVESVSSQWGPLTEYSEDRLLKNIKSKTDRKLTTSETKYLRSLVQRAIAYGDGNKKESIRKMIGLLL